MNEAYTGCRRPDVIYLTYAYALDANTNHSNI